MNSFVIKGNFCYCTDKNNLVIKENSYAVCIDSLCQGVYDELPQEFSSLNLFDYGDMLIIPGLVDLHTHAPQFAFRGLNMDLELLDWLQNCAFPEEAKYSDLSYAEKAYDIFVQSLKHSATTRACVFATLHKDATTVLMDKLEQSGLVSYVGKVNMDRNSPDFLCESSAEKSTEDTRVWLESTAVGYKNTKPIITPRFIPSCSDSLMKKLSELQKEFNVPVQSHLSENKDEIRWVRQLCPDSATYSDAYDKYGFFGKDTKTVMAHCVHLSDSEINLAQQNGVFIAHCPSSNSNLCSGIAPVKKYLDKNLAVGIGSDVAAGETLSLFCVMVEAIKVSKLYHSLVDTDVKPLRFEEAFYMATKGGGEFFSKVGSFEKGYEFDAVIIDDSVLPYAQQLSVRERLERSVYLHADLLCVKAKFVRGNKII